MQENRVKLVVIQEVERVYYLTLGGSHSIFNNFLLILLEEGCFCAFTKLEGSTAVIVYYTTSNRGNQNNKTKIQTTKQNLDIFPCFGPAKLG